MKCHEANSLNLIFSDWLPFFVAFVTSIAVYLAARIQGKATLKAAKLQSEATIETMSKSLDSQFRLKKFEMLKEAITELIFYLYLAERNPKIYFQDEKSMLLAIAKLSTFLQYSETEESIRKLLETLRFDLINKGDTSQIPLIREKLEQILPLLIMR